MSLPQSFNSTHPVQTRPSPREQIGQGMAAQQRRTVVCQLQRFRERLEREMEPEPWTALRAPMVLLLSDICDTLGLEEEDRLTVLGPEGQQALADILGERPVVSRLPAFFNERQVKALAHVRGHGAINLGVYRQLCPHWSAETLRRDLADLVARGLLVKNGHKKGTYYTPAP